MQRYTSLEANIGRWDTIHSVGANADQVNNLPTRRVYAFIVRLVVDNHPCQECRDHGTRWLSMNPPEAHFNRLDGCLYHSWLFHDSVNARIGKPRIPYPVVRSWYAPVITNGCTMVHDPVTGRPSLQCIDDKY